MQDIIEKAIQITGAHSLHFQEPWWHTFQYTSPWSDPNFYFVLASVWKPIPVQTHTNS